MLEILLALFLGIIIGTITGLIPGLHVNTVLAFAMVPLISISISPASIIVMIVAMAVTHSMLDHIPSILLGAPSTDSVLSVLPGHELLMKGQGYEAVMLAVIGGVITSIAAILLAPLFFMYLGLLGSKLNLLVPGLILTTIVLSVLSEEKTKKIGLALLVTILAGALGVISFNSFGGESIFPALTGLFGLSTLVFSLKHKQKIPKQKITKLKLDNRETILSSVKAALGGSFMAFFPALGPAQAAFIIQQLFGKFKTKSYLIMIGGVNTAVAIYSFFVLFLLGKAHTGATVAIKNILPGANTVDVWLLMMTALVAIGISTLFSRILAKALVTRIQKIDYTRINLIVIAFLLTLVGIFNGAIGIGITLAGTAIGLLSLLSGVRRINAMAYLAIPTLLIYLG